jgi:hypothetical protein
LLEQNTIYKKELEEIIDGMQCPKGFQCYKSGLKSLCKAKKFDVYESLMCLNDEDAQKCLFSERYAYKYFCKCPLRNYIAEKVGK